MTVHITKGSAPVPLSAIIGIMVTLILACAGWAAYAIQRGADVEHRILSQVQVEQSHDITSIAEVSTSNTFSISDLKIALAVLTQKTEENNSMLRWIQTKLR